MTDKLKPCPFCGDLVGVEARQPWKWEGKGNDAWIVECEDCGADSGAFEYKESAIEWWNRRPSEGKQTAILLGRIAELEDLVSDQE